MMKKIFDNSFAGWALAAVLVGLTVGAGFKDPSPKMATIDIGKITNTCDAGKAEVAAINAVRKSRLDLLQFIATNGVISADDAAQLRTLSVIANPTPANQSALTTLQNKVIADEKKYEDLQKNTTISASDKTLLDDYASRTEKSKEIAQQWNADFRDELQNLAQDDQVKLIDSIRATASKIAKTQDCSIVYDSSVAPYSENDITDATLAAMNASK